MDEGVRVGLMLAGAATVIAGGAYFGVGIADAGDALEENAAYQVKRVYKNVDRNLSSAQSELKYRAPYTTFILAGKVMVPIYHPANYPDCIDAVTDLDDAVSWYHKAPESEGDYLEIELRIDSVKDSLPRENDIKKYLGEKVRNKTFEEQRDNIEDIRDDIQARIEEYDSRVPEDLKNGKSLAITGLVLSVLAGLGIAGAGFFSDDDYFF